MLAPPAAGVRRGSSPAAGLTFLTSSRWTDGRAQSRNRSAKLLTLELLVRQWKLFFVVVVVIVVDTITLIFIETSNGFFAF